MTVVGLGLTRKQLQVLPYLAQLLLRTLASLRDAWVEAAHVGGDMHVVMAIKSIMAHPTSQTNRDAALVVLRYKLDAEQARKLLDLVYPKAWVKK